jgi:YidC/Oxa1 family membrane protein insertase
MDVKRLILLVPLAVLAYLLVVQWNQDYGQSAEPLPGVESTQRNNGAASNAEADGNSLTVPSSATSAEAGDDLADEAGSSDNKSRDFIAVTTDVLDVRIDPHGGDIVYAALPQHKKTLESERNYVMLSDNSVRSYVARSGLQLDGEASRIAFTPENTEYHLSEGQDQLDVDLTAEVNGVEVTKRLSFERDNYAINVRYLVANNTEAPVSARFIGQLVRDDSPDPTSGSGMGMRSFLGAAYSTPESRYEKVDFEDIQEGSVPNREAEGGWVAILQHYFVSAWAPPQNQKNLFYATTDSKDRNVVAFAGPTQDIGAQ